MRNIILVSSAILIIFLVGNFVLQGMIIQDVKRENTELRTFNIAKIYESTGFDIVFKGSHGEHYYINRGAEQGLVTRELQNRLLGRNVEVSLPRVLTGISSHISELTFEGNVIFSEIDQ